MVIEDNRKLNYEQLCYKYIKEIKILHDYTYNQLEEIEESYELEKMTTKVLELTIEQLVENQVKETEDKIAKIK